MEHFQELARMWALIADEFRSVSMQSLGPTCPTRPGSYSCQTADDQQITLGFAFVRTHMFCEDCTDAELCYLIL